jgi:hypothetical protein
MPGSHSDQFGGPKGNTPYVPSWMEPMNEEAALPDWAVALDQVEPDYGPIRKHLGDVHDRLVRCVNAHDALVAALRDLVAQHDRPHGFDDSHWYAQALEPVRALLAEVEPNEE